MYNINKLIPHIPLIIRAREMKFSFNKIRQVLNDNFNIETSEDFTRRFYYKIIDQTLKKEYKNIKCFIKDNSTLVKHDISPNEYVEFMESFYISDATLNIPENILIDINNIRTIHNPVARIYAKWFSRNFYIDNSSILSKFEIECTEEQHEIIKLIPDSIDITYDKIMLELLTKRLR